MSNNKLRLFAVISARRDLVDGVLHLLAFSLFSFSLNSKNLSLFNIFCAFFLNISVSHLYEF